MKFSEEIMKVFDYVGTKLGVAIDWSSENVLPYLQDLAERFIRFKIQTCIIAIVVCVVLIVLGALLAIWDVWKDYTEGGAFLFSCIVILISIVVIAYNSYKIVECNNIPEKVIYEYVSHELKK